VNEARANAAAIGRRMALLQSGYREEEIAQARLESAENSLTEQQTGYRQQEIAETEATHARAVAAAAEAEQRLADAVLNAPAGGIVLTRAVEAGAILAAATADAAGQDAAGRAQLAREYAALGKALGGGWQVDK
jgi:HlyD family secretion protein